MASVTWPPRVTAAPISSSVKVARARPGTAAARRPMRAARTGETGTAVVDIGRKRTKGGTVTSTAVIGSRRHARRPDDPQAHPRLPVRTGWARAGALPRQRLQPGRPALRRAAGAPAADRRGRRCRPALPVPPRLGASGRLRGGRHAARPRPRAAQRQSVLPGTPPDLLLSGGTQPGNAQPQTLFPVNFSILCPCELSILGCPAGCPGSVPEPNRLTVPPAHTLSMGWWDSRGPDDRKGTKTATGTKAARTDGRVSFPVPFRKGKARTFSRS